MKILKLKNIKHIEGISSLREEENCSLNVNDEELTVISNIRNFNMSLDIIVNKLTKRLNNEKVNIDL